MSYSAADGYALVAAAVGAAIREKAPKRTVAAVTAAAVGAVLSASARPAPAAAMPKAHPPKAPNLPDNADDDPAHLLATLRAVRSRARVRKKQRRREAKQAARNSQDLSTEAQHFAEPSLHSGTAGLCAEHVGASAAVPAPVPESLSAAASTRQPCGLPLQHVDRDMLSLLGIDDDSASNATSAGMIRQSRAASDFRHSPYSGGNPSAGGQ